MLSLCLAPQHLKGTGKLLARYMGPEEATQVISYLGTERTLAFLKPRVDFLVQTQPPQTLAPHLREAVTEVGTHCAAAAVVARPCILVCGLPSVALRCHTGCAAGCCCEQLRLFHNSNPGQGMH